MLPINGVVFSFHEYIEATTKLIKAIIKKFTLTKNAKPKPITFKIIKYTKADFNDIFPDGSVTDVKDYVASGSGSTAGALPVLDTLYKENLSLEDGTDLCIKAINAAIQRDTCTGSGIDVVTITKDGTKKVFTKQLDTKLAM